MDANRRHPSKEEVRAWMARRQVSCRAGLPLPLPSPAELRRELGWHQPPPARPQEGAALLLPIVLAELAALTAVAWYWSILPGACNRRRPLS